jgi:aminopeptidase N
VTNRSDPDPVNRYLAYASVVDAEKAKLIEAAVAGITPLPTVSPMFLQLYLRILTDESLSPATRALFLNVHEAIPSRGDLGHHYQYIADARRILLTAIYQTHGTIISKMFQKLFQEGQDRQGAAQIDGLMERPLMYVLYSILEVGQSLTLPPLLQTLLSSTAMSDRFFALRAILQSKTMDMSEIKSIQATVKEEWSSHPIGCEQYIMCISTVDCDQTTEYIRELVNESFFNINLAGHARTVARGWSANRKRCLMTKEGLLLTEELFLKIGKVNQMSAYSFLSSFGDLRKFSEEIQTTLVATLESMKSQLDPEKQLSLSNQLTVLMKK